MSGLAKTGITVLSECCRAESQTKIEETRVLKIIHTRTELGTPTRIDYADTITEAEVTLAAEYGPVVVKRKRRGWRADNEVRLVAEIYEES